MDARDSNAAWRELAERIVFSAVGAVALTAERADALAEELSMRGLARRDDARALIEELSARWRGDATRFGERAGATHFHRDLQCLERLHVGKQPLPLPRENEEVAVGSAPGIDL